jgi:hypothetical protein
MRNIFSER